MSAPEHQQLIAFLGERFETIDRRFEAIDRRFDELRGEILGHFDELYRCLVLNARIEDIERRLRSS